MLVKFILKAFNDVASFVELEPNKKLYRQNTDLPVQRLEELAADNLKI